MKDSEVKGKFTRMVSERRGNPKLVVNIEVFKDGDLCEETESAPLWNLKSQRIFIVRRVRTEEKHR